MMLQEDAAGTSHDEVTNGLVDVLQKYTKVPRETLTPETTLAEAEIDSFGFVELVFEIEDRFGIEIKFNANAENNQAITLGRVLDYIREGLAAKAVPA